MSEPMKVWRFHEAPKELQKLSECGGDENYLALVPVSWSDEEIWMIGMERVLGANDVDVYRLPSGERVLIGSHA